MTEAQATAEQTEIFFPRPFHLVAPGRWFCLELVDDAQIRAQLRHFVREAAGVRDDVALFRADARRRLFDQALAARGAGATHQFFCLELMPKVPFPASFTVFWPLVVFPTTEADGAPVEALEEWCERELVRDGLGETGGFPVGDTAVVRRSGVRTESVLGHGQLGETDVVRADFWVTVPGTDRLALFAFQSPLVLDPEKVLSLFTVMMCSLTWGPDTEESS